MLNPQPAKIALIRSPLLLTIYPFVALVKTRKDVLACYGSKMVAEHKKVVRTFH